MPKAKMPKKLPLRITIMVLILLCWVLPILVTVGASGYISYQKTYRHVSDIVTTAVENAMDIVTRDLNSVVAASINASYVPTIRNAYGNLLVGKGGVDFHNEVNRYLQQEYYRNQLIRSAHVVFPAEEAQAQLGGQRFFVYNPSVSNFADSQAFYTNGALNEAMELLRTLETDIAFIQLDGRLYLARVLSLISNRFEPYALLVMEVNLDTVYEPLRSLPWVTGVMLELNGGEARLTPVEGEEGMNFADFPAPPATGTRSTRGGQDDMRLAGGTRSERFALTYYAQANLRPLLREIGTPLGVLVLLAGLSLVLMAVVFAFFVRKITRPIRALSALAGRIEEGELGAQAEAETLGSAEFVYLGTQMNAMSAKLRDQFERLYREELALRDARIKALQSQINPHFLGNTLEIINWEARLAGNVKVSRMMEALSTMMEAALDRRRRPLVHLSEEMMYVNAYLYIIRERLGKRLEVEQEIDAKLLSWDVPRLILQPIVENAVEHGVSTKQRGIITIRAMRVDEEWMRLEVVNNTAMSEEDEEKVARLLSDETEAENETSSNIGIRNVHLRLRILYGPKSGLSIKTDKMGNTISSMCIHYPQGTQENAI